MTEVISIYLQFLIFFIIFQFPINKSILNSYSKLKFNFFEIITLNVILHLFFYLVISFLSINLKVFSLLLLNGALSGRPNIFFHLLSEGSCSPFSQPRTVLSPFPFISKYIANSFWVRPIFILFSSINPAFLLRSFIANLSCNCP